MLRTIILLAMISTTAPASPTSQSSAEANLRRIIRGLQQQIAELKAENTTLKNQARLGVGAKDEIPPADIPNTFASRTEAAIKNRKTGYENQDGSLDPKQAKELRDRAAKTDASIARYAASHDIPRNAIEVMYAGDVAIGMTQDEISLYGNLQKETETSNTERDSFTPWRLPIGTWDQTIYYEITFTDGIVSSIDRPRGG